MCEVNKLSVVPQDVEVVPARVKGCHLGEIVPIEVHEVSVAHLALGQLFRLVVYHSVENLAWIPSLEHVASHDHDACMVRPYGRSVPKKALSILDETDIAALRQGVPKSLDILKHKLIRV